MSSCLLWIHCVTRHLSTGFGSFLPSSETKETLKDKGTNCFLSILRMGLSFHFLTFQMHTSIIFTWPKCFIVLCWNTRMVVWENSFFRKYTVPAWLQTFFCSAQDVQFSISRTLHVFIWMPECLSTRLWRKHNLSFLDCLFSFQPCSRAVLTSKEEWQWVLVVQKPDMNL